jgi:hypothetical protein
VAGLRDLTSGPWRVSPGSLLSALIAAGIMGAMVVPAADDAAIGASMVVVVLIGLKG